LADTPKPNEKKSEKPTNKDEQVEDPQPNAPSEIVDESQPAPSTEDAKEEVVEDKSVDTDEQVKEDPIPKSEVSDVHIEETIETNIEKKPALTKPKEEVKKDDAKKKDGKKDDFKYIVRIANTDVDGDKTLVRGLTSIKGIGMHMSVLIADAAGIDRYKKIGDLSDMQIEKIKTVLENINDNAPKWMLNHRKDLDSGEDIHLIGAEIDMRLRDEINIMKKIRSYKGIRHELGLRVRGQRTRANNRKGLSLGVSKKGAQQTKKSKE
jgi:small subunit ribosomal protein S13